MKNKVEKTNKTRFDYIARRLGVIGLAVMALTFIIGGNALISVKEENQTLIKSISTKTKFIEKTQMAKDPYEKVLQIADGKVEVNFEE